jgi:hypothetical protein
METREGTGQPGKGWVNRGNAVLKMKIWIYWSESNFLNLCYTDKYVNKYWKIYWSEQSFTGLRLET